VETPFENRKCVNCNKVYTPKVYNQKYCSTECVSYFSSGTISSSSRSNTGDVSEYMVCCDLMLKMWYVYKHIGTNSPFDVFIYRDGEYYRVEIKSGRINSINGNLAFSNPKNKDYDILAVYNLDESSFHYWDKDGNDASVLLDVRKS